MRAVKAGYCFNLFSEQELSHIELEPVGRKVKVEGVTYALYRGRTYADSEKVDRLLDMRGDLRIADYAVKEKDKER